MFGFSLPKLLLLALLVAVVWYGFRMFERRGARARREEVERAAEAAVRATVERRRAGERAESADTAACGTCGSYVPVEGARACGREGCPYPA